MSRVALVGLSKAENRRLIRIYGKVGVNCDVFANFEAAIERLPADPPTLVLAQQPPQIQTVQTLHTVLKGAAPTTPLLVSIPKQDATIALAVMNKGAYECLSRPLTRLNVLAASKRAVSAQGRSLFASPIKEDRNWVGVLIGGLLLVGAALKGLISIWQGPPSPTLDLAAATLSGIQFEARSLWVANWMDANITHYQVTGGFTEKQRALKTDEIFKVQDSQPIAVCNTPNALMTVGFDLKIRSHQKSVGLPTLQTTSAPGPNPTGLAWDGAYLWSTDSQTGMIYKHGPDLKVIDATRSLLPNPVGMAWGEDSLWVLSDSPLRVARYRKTGTGWVWEGPYLMPKLLAEGVQPSGMAVGFDRIWVITGGAPYMVSRPIVDVVEKVHGWEGK